MAKIKYTSLWGKPSKTKKKVKWSKTDALGLKMFAEGVSAKKLRKVLR